MELKKGEFKAMQNEPIVSTPTNFDNKKNTLRGPNKAPNLKLLGICLGVVLVLVIVGVVLILPRQSGIKSGEFNDDAYSSRDVSDENKYVSIENYDSLEFSDLSPYQESEIQEKLTLFFSYVFPNFSTLTVSNIETSEISSPEDVSSEENPVTTKATSFMLTSDTGKKFSVLVETNSNEYNYLLTINNSNGKELYSYTGGEITEDLYDHFTSSLLDAIITKLPYSGTLDSGETYEVTYEGDEEDRLTISSSNCSDAIKSAVSWANTLKIDYLEDVTENDFVCEAE